MTIESVTEVVKWMTIINVGILVGSSVLVMIFKRVLYRAHSKMFRIPEENVAAITYGYLGAYRLLVIVFNIVPYIALSIVR